MTAVPRFYQNLISKKLTLILIRATGFKKFLINKTLELGKKNYLKKKLSSG